jgi:hypothetical protein
MVELSVLDTYGDIETGKDDAMVVRVLGYDIGLSAGWFHFNGGWCVFVPDFKPKDEAELYFGIPYTKFNMVQNMGLVIDFYMGQMALVSHPPKGTADAERQIKVLWSGPVKITHV